MGPTIITPRLSSIAPQHLLEQSSDFILGGLLMLLDSVLAALFFIAQALILKKYSAVVIVVLAYCFQPSLPNGLFGSRFQSAIGAWCVKTKGPLFVAIFQPLGIVIAATLGVLFLGDGLYLGCLIGSAGIVVGFYGVMWGKSIVRHLVHYNNIHIMCIYNTCTLCRVSMIGSYVSV
ncbi:hypothetical protein HanXRQr2_Chr08g0317551 [Helianthus annuus]|uniref:Putative WAT1-related protein n=1 Tax=Helianthus annuus TaxID=4232 RepID=A0A251U2C1_HELAN|nr:hypothetical protein HanXRQr2_Chr08g0317551 [Helianthus annuus]